MEYIKFNNEAKGVLSGEAELIEKAEQEEYQRQETELRDKFRKLFGE